MKYDKMIAVNKAESEKKVEKAIQAIEDMRCRGVQASVTELTRCTGLSRGFFYKIMLVRQKLDEVTKQFLSIFKAEIRTGKFAGKMKITRGCGYLINRSQKYIAIFALEVDLLKSDFIFITECFAI